MLQEKNEVSKSDAYEVKLSVEEFEKLKRYIRGCYKYRIARYVVLIVTLLFALSMVALPICTTMGNTVVFVITGAVYIIALGLVIGYIVKKLSYTGKMTYENMSERMWLYKTKCINRKVWVETHGTGEDRQTTVHIDYNLAGAYTIRDSIYQKTGYDIKCRKQGKLGLLWRNEGANSWALVGDNTDVYVAVEHKGNKIYDIGIIPGSLDLDTPTLNEDMIAYRDNYEVREIELSSGELREYKANLLKGAVYNLFMVLVSIAGYFLVYLWLSGFIDAIWSYSLFGNPFKISAEVQRVLESGDYGIDLYITLIKDFMYQAIGWVPTIGVVLYGLVRIIKGFVLLKDVENFKYIEDYSFIGKTGFMGDRRFKTLNMDKIKEYLSNTYGYKIDNKAILEMRVPNIKRLKNKVSPLYVVYTGKQLYVIYREDREFISLKK